MAGKFEVYEDKGGEVPVPSQRLATARSWRLARPTRPRPPLRTGARLFRGPQTARRSWTSRTEPNPACFRGLELSEAMRGQHRWSVLSAAGHPPGVGAAGGGIDGFYRCRIEYVGPAP